MTLNSNKRLKVLISVHEISPVVGSECTSGWNIITRLGAYHDITVMHAETNQFGTNNYKEHIDTYILKNGSVPGVQFIAIPQPSITTIIARFNKKISDKKTSVGLSFLYFLGAKFWEGRVFKFTRKLNEERHFDLIHHFNHLSFREPGFLWKIDKPFVWGPLSGLSRVPLSYLKSMPIGEKIYNILRNILNYAQFYLNARVRRAIKNSDLIYFVTSDDGKFLEKEKCRIKNLLDMGATEIHEIRGVRYINSKIKVLWVGRFSYLKALDILLKAIGASSTLREKLELSIIGDGPQKGYYMKMAADLNLTNVEWLGQIPKGKVFEKMLEANALVHTSIKEAASAVILESISAGLPIICHDAFGMSFSVNEKCGIKVPFISPAKSILYFQEALEKICNNPNLAVELSNGALNRARELTWDSMAEEVANDYFDVVKTNIK